MTTTAPGIVARRENAPQDFPRNKAIHPLGERDFRDARYWNELANRLLPRHDQPLWNAPCSPDAMETWLDRLSIPLKDYLRATGLKRLQDFIDLNLHWPLRAFIGLALEMKNEGGQQRATMMLGLRED